MATAKAEAAPDRDQILELICVELRIKPDQLTDLPSTRLEDEIRRRLPERGRNWALDVSPAALADSIERLKKNRPSP